LYFLASAFFLFVPQTIVKFPGPWHRIAFDLTIFFFTCGVGLGQWARSESAFLGKPDPEEP
jgi:hypothetical protein